MKDETYSENSWFHTRPGLILGPYESLLAILMCIAESITFTKMRYVPADLYKMIPRVHSIYRQKLLRAFLLFGSFDGMCGMPLVDDYLLFHGGMESRRELFGDILQDYEKHSPFAHSLESLLFTVFYPSAAAASDAEAERLTPAIIRALRRTGYKVEMNKMRPTDRLRFGDEAFKNEIVEELRFAAAASRNMEIGTHHVYLNTLVSSCFAMIDRAIRLECPLLSVDAVGPAWVSRNSTDSSIQIMKIIWDEIGWLPQPTSFREARLMAEDDRLHGLRNDIHLWSQKISVGDISTEQDLRAKIRYTTKAFQKKPWATKISHFITYAAIPTSIADLLLGGGMIGLAVAGLGTATQLIASKLEAKKKNHWLSLGKDFISR